VWPHEDWLVDLDLDSGTVTTTEDHHFWNDTDQQWQESQDLDPGDDRPGRCGGSTSGVDEGESSTAWVGP
jgi:hypothetical protein